VRPDHLRLDRLASPIGEVLLVTDEAGRLRALDFHDYEPRMLRLLRLHYGDQPLEIGAAPTATRAALDAYFAGAPTRLAAIRWATAGTAFQRQVWTALVDIPIGQPVT
jgi:methylated-DNA-[protein]-cysteine S-methyltransferase